MKKVNISGVLCLIIILALLAISFLIPYLISISNLPDWFKFWLLK